MRLAVISDIHDNLWNLAVAIEQVSAGAEVLICCGDLCSPFVMDVLARFPRQVEIVFGNNDADLFRITRKSTARVRVHGEFFETELGGKKIAVNHFNDLARPMAASGLYDYVLYGHNHEFSVARIGRTLAVNPGPIMGARFSGQWLDVLPTFVMIDTASGTVEAFGIHAGVGVARRVLPHEYQGTEGWPD